MSEGSTEHEADSPFLGVRLDVVDTMHIFHMQQFEDVVDTNDELHVRPLGLHHLAVVVEGPIGIVVAREIIQAAVVLVLRQERIVLV